MGAQPQQPNPSQDAASVMRDMSVEELTRACEEGSQAACAELDRRGVEPASVPLDQAIEENADVIPLGRLDLTRERQPDAAWLREYAGAMKTEADMLEQHAEAYFLQFAESKAETPEERESLQRAVHCQLTAATLRTSIDSLLRLAGLLTSTGPLSA